MVVAPYIHRDLPIPKTSFFLFGMRGSGKSTWLHHCLKDVKWIDLLDEALYQHLLYDISTFSAELNALSSSQWVIIDEIQRLPQLLNYVHKFIEEKRLKFALTGSSSRKIKRVGVNLLGGRAQKRMMYPLMPAELGTEFDLTKVIQYGSLPLIWMAVDKKESLTAYSQVYLKEEIQAEAVARNLPGFARFLPIAALFHGQVLNISSLARDAGIARTTASGYIEVLEDTLLAWQLSGYEGKLRVKERRHPKLYWFDAGVMRACKKMLVPPEQAEAGTLFEGLIANILRFYGERQDLYDEIYYWAPTSTVRLEVDFLLQRSKEIIAIEAKYSDRLKPEHLKGLKAISALPNLTRKILVYTGPVSMLLDNGIEVLPFQTFIEALEANRI